MCGVVCFVVCVWFWLCGVWCVGFVVCGVVWFVLWCLCGLFCFVVCGVVCFVVCVWRGGGGCEVCGLVEVWMVRAGLVVGPRCARPVHVRLVLRGGVASRHVATGGRRAAPPSASYKGLLIFPL